MWDWDGQYILGCWLGRSWNSCRGSGCRRAIAEASPESLVHFSWVFHRKAFAEYRSHCGNLCLRSSFSEMCSCAGCILWEQTNVCNHGSRGRVKRTQTWRQSWVYFYLLPVDLGNVTDLSWTLVSSSVKQGHKCLVKEQCPSINGSYNYKS